MVRIDGIPVEVQFRTQLQDLWAQVFEQLADVWGRQIRYGGALLPDPRPRMIDIKNGVVDSMFDLGANVARYEELCCLGAIKGMEAEVAGLDLEHHAPDEVLPPARRPVGSNYLAYRAARDEAERQFRSKLAELVERIAWVEAQ